MRAYIIPVTLLLGGCSGLMGVSPDVDYEVVVASVVRDCSRSPGLNVSASTAMEVGFAKVQAACEGFFVQATRAQQDALAANRSLDLGLVAATAIINATNPAANAAKAITITQAGVVLSKALLDEYSKIYTFNTHLYKVRELTTRSMEDYIARSRLAPPPPDNHCLAYTYVQKLATMCTLAALRANLDGQVALPSNIQPNGPPDFMRRMPPLAPPLGPRSSGSGGPPSASYSVQPR
jgi:hypothetical protein